MGVVTHLLVGVDLVGFLGQLGAVFVESLPQVLHFHSAAHISCRSFSIFRLKFFLHKVIAFFLFDFQHTSHEVNA